VQNAHLTLEGPLGVGGVQVNSSGDTLEVVNSHGEHIGDDQALTNGGKQHHYQREPQ